YPLSAYPTALQWVVELTPLYRAVVLCRELVTGALSLGSLASVAYLLVMGGVGVYVASGRLGRLLLK
ncbi:MAG: ABC transporter permease, partial [Nocardioidaceae bacterium]